MLLVYLVKAWGISSSATGCRGLVCFAYPFSLPSWDNLSRRELGHFMIGLLHGDASKVTTPRIAFLRRFQRRNLSTWSVRTRKGDIIDKGSSGASWFRAQGKDSPASPKLILLLGLMMRIVRWIGPSLYWTIQRVGGERAYTGKSDTILRHLYRICLTEVWPQSFSK